MFSNCPPGNQTCLRFWITHSPKHWRFATMFTTSCFLAVVFAAGSPALGAPADEKQVLETKSQATVRLKLNVVETGKLLARYEKLLQREMDLQENVDACNKS